MATCLLRNEREDLYTTHKNLIMNKMKWLLFPMLLLILQTQAQTLTPDLQDKSQWTIINRSVEPTNENGKNGIRFSEAGGEGFMILKGVEFGSGTIEFDVKGKNVVQQSFVGIAFHGQDEKTFDAVYFRPFNFLNPDTARRRRAVQYISMPAHPWETLREKHPGKYENKVDPAPNPDDWFHTTIVVDGKNISVYVNGAKQASLQVEKLSNTTKGGLALWVGNNSGGSFANLTITHAAPSAATGQHRVPYGNNPEAGKYVNVGDAKLYYEVYGSGKPLVLLHGGVYGSIGEFQNFIPKLAEDFQVICLATRGHGKSEAGKAPFTYKQRADDAYKLIRSITQDSVIVLGFSDGAYSGFKLAALYPQVVKKLIAIGASDNPKTSAPRKFNYTAESLMKTDSAFFASRLQQMPEPKRWNEVLGKLSRLYNEDYMSTETFSKIKCPVLVMSGDRDTYHTTEKVVKCARAIPNAQLSVIPGCSHVVFFCNFPAVWEAITPFLR
jgi:pimeloyl-ACP methyl ester carboxylesterase